MKSFKYLILLTVAVMFSAVAQATPDDPTIILRNGGGSEPIAGTAFGGFFPTPTGSPFACPDDGVDNNCYENINPFTFTGIELTFTNLNLIYGCENDDSHPLFTGCSVANNVVTFSGLNTDYYSSYFENDDSGCPVDQGITSDCHFEISIVGLPQGVTTGYTGLADTATSETPEPAPALLFVIAMGAIALLLKRRNSFVAA